MRTGWLVRVCLMGMGLGWFAMGPIASARASADELPPPAADEREPAADACDEEPTRDACTAEVPLAPSTDERGDAPSEESADEPASPGPEVPSEGTEADAGDALATSAEAALVPAVAEEVDSEPLRDPRVPLDEPELVTLRIPPGPAPLREGLGFGGIPALNYDSDNGFGFGVVGSLYWYERGVEPYRYALTLILFATTKLVQDHQIRFDAVELFDLPLRLTLRGGYYQSRTQNFCGFGNEVSCDPHVAEVEAARLGLRGSEREDFLRRYYFLRITRPYLQGLARWRLLREPVKVELMAGWRGHLLLPGDPWADDDGDGAPDLAFRPYPGSLYEKVFPGGESGFASVFTAGVMFDKRDREASPTRGYWVEGTLRASSSWLGSSWDYAGGNLTARTYLPLFTYGEHHLVLAQRLVLDATVGDLPVAEMIRVGGSWDYTAFGGNPMGRGIRVQRYVGRIKVLEQIEARADVFRHELFGQRFRWGLVGLVDAGWIGVDWQDLGGDPYRILLGFGGGLRLAWNEDFVIRADVATSPIERFAPAVYIDIGQTF